jgi:hypothetical protein
MSPRTINIVALTGAVAAFAAMLWLRPWVVALCWMLVLVVVGRAVHRRWPNAAMAFVQGAIRGLFRRRR